MDKVKVENDVITGGGDETKMYTGIEIRAIKVEKDDAPSEDGISAAASTSNYDSRGQCMFVDTGSIKEEENSELYSDMPTVKVKIETEYLSEEEFRNGYSGNERKEMKKEEADVLSDDRTSFGEGTSFGSSNDQSVDTSVLTKEENLGVCYEEEDGSPLVGADSSNLFEDEANSHCANEALVKTEINHGVDKFGEAESCFLESAVLSTGDSKPIVLNDEKSSRPQGDASAPSDGKRFACTNCAARFKTKTLLRLHLYIHSSERAFACTQCPATFKRPTNLRAHLTTHLSERPFACSSCSWRFTHKDALKKHLRTHSEEKPFCCPLCPAKFTFKSSLKAHRSSVHLKEKPFACTYCPTTFAYKSNLKRHVDRHMNDKPFMCPHCPAKFVSESGLKLHSKVHLSVKPISCPHCAAKFIQNSNLKTHLATVHSSEKPFSCDHCPANFALKCYLQLHLRAHTKTKPFSCPHCSATFTRQGKLNEHVRFVHLNDKPFCCTHCPAKFTCKSQMKRHLLAHSNAEPLVCPHCPARFSRKVNLQKHLTVHSN